MRSEWLNGEGQGAFSGNRMGRFYFCECEHCGSWTGLSECPSCGAPVLDNEVAHPGVPEFDFYCSTSQFDQAIHPYHNKGGIGLRGGRKKEVVVISTDAARMIFDRAG